MKKIITLAVLTAALAGVVSTASAYNGGGYCGGYGSCGGTGICYRTCSECGGTISRGECTECGSNQRLYQNYSAGNGTGRGACRNR